MSKKIKIKTAKKSDRAINFFTSLKRWKFIKKVAAEKQCFMVDVLNEMIDQYKASYDLKNEEKTKENS